jgi:YVTN family beta-propeller protein
MMLRYLSFLYLLITISTHASNRVFATIGVGDTPTGIAITPDNQFAYVANNFNDFPSGGSVSVISIKTNTVVMTINDPSFNEPYSVTINPAGTKVYVTNSQGSTVTIIDTATNTVVGVIDGFDGPSGFAITPNGNTAYVNNYGGPKAGSGNGTTVSVVDLNTDTITGTITVGQAPASLAITPNGEFVYVINYVLGNTGDGTISIIQTSNNTVVGTILGFSGPFQIAITPNGKFAYVTNFGSNNFSPVGTTVSVVDLTSNTITTAIPLGTQPSGIALSANGRLAYVTNYNTLYLGAGFTDLTPGTGTVNIIDTRTNTVLSPVFIVGSSPADIAVTSDGKYAYVTNFSSNNVSVINILDKMWLNVYR